MPKITIEEPTSVPAINIALDTIKKQKQALIFVNTKRSAEKTAEELSFKIKTTDKKLEELSEQIIHALTRPTKQCERLAKVIKKGIAFHHAGLVQKQKTLIEDNFRKGLIKIICATPTLAMGVDLPAFRAILKDLRRYSHRGLTYIPVLEYLQMAGRAGRPKFDKYGESICIAHSKSNKEQLIEKYIKGEPEDIFSKLAVEPALRMYILSLIASEFVNTKQDLFDFFSKTFFAFQFQDLKKINSLIEKILNLLEEWEFIKSSAKQDFTSADELQNEKYKATILGKRIAELYIDPLTAHNLVVALQKAASKIINEFSFLQLISSTLEIRPLLKARMKEYDIIEEALVKYSDYLLQNEPSPWEPEYEDFINSIKTALFFDDWINEKDEEYLLETYSIRPGEINVKINNGDWLLYAAEELARILRFQKLIKEIVKLRIRLKNGVKEELITLLKLEQVGRVRARTLHRNRIRDIADVKKADYAKLVYLLGKKVALKVKEQVGQDFSKIKIKEHKRKGQISLKDY
jgi:helicase